MDIGGILVSFLRDYPLVDSFDNFSHSVLDVSLL